MMSTLCDNAAVENIDHIVMQCPDVEAHRAIMYNEIEKLNPHIVHAMLTNPSRVLYWILGGQIEDITHRETSTVEDAKHQ